MITIPAYRDVTCYARLKQLQFVMQTPCSTESAWKLEPGQREKEMWKQVGFSLCLLLSVRAQSDLPSQV
jgi:hypothetical protein